MEYIPVRVSDIIRQVNRAIFLPAIQREFGWGTDRIERLFDSIMADFPVGSFLYFSWKSASLKDERGKKLGEIIERRGQPDFRNKLIAAYSGRCAIYGCDAVAALEAAHIVPYTRPQSNHFTNGLLRADIHTLFDLDLIGIELESMAISLALAIKATVYAKLDGKKLLLPVNAADIPNREALAQRWERFCGEKDGVG